ncbi:MAG: hypothetical protein J1F04_08865 [Oscillospiraceae bacterium]|nr:hypothetical protein [Oscillospiraceae bacterium]
MNISLIIQCIDTFGFVPAEDKLSFFADGKRFFPVRKSGGFYIASKELPNEFALSVRSDVYYSFECLAALEKEILRINLIRKAPPPRKTAVWLNVGSYGIAALEYGYFCLNRSVRAGDEHISAENPYRFCLEGRSFLLLDTHSGAEEFVVLEKAENALMTDYSVKKLANDYGMEHSVMLPAFDLYVKEKIPIEKPFVGTATVRLYGESGGNAVRVRAEDAL